MENILVSINCITYNHEKYISKAIEGFLMQKTDFDFEILIHDDASTDGTQNIIKKYQEKYPDIIKPILQKENKYSKGIKRIGYLYNHKRAKGKYIAWCEGDDYWTDEYKLQKQINYMESHEDCGLIFHNAKMVNEITQKDNGYMIDLNINNKICKIDDLLELKFIPTASVIYRKCTMDNPPEWYMNAVVGDLPGNLISANCKYAYYIKDVMSVYRVGNMNSAVNQWVNQQKSINERILHCKRFIDILDNFNKFSNYKNNEAINKCKIYWEFEIEKLKGNISNIKQEKYKENYKQLSNKDIIVIYLIKYLPKLYIKLSKTKFMYKKLMQNIIENRR